MLFNSVEFIFYFLPVAIIGYYLTAGFNHRAAVAWLCAMSIFFYAWWNPTFVIILSGSIACNYLVSVFLFKTSDAPRRQLILLIIGVSANLALLIYFKYLFAMLSFANNLGFLTRDFGNVVLPLGISFFTFTQIGYLIDIRSGLAGERGVLNYILFVSFFPHLIAGPIMHHKEMMPQFADPTTYRFRIENISVGLTLFVLGLAKKVLLADRISPWAETGFASPDNLGLFASWGAVLSYSLQLYFDFSGYSDMAIGLAKMFGVRFPLNFYSPYKSANIIEFWQSWHMTLTRYLTLYLFNPLALGITRWRARKGLPIGRRGVASLGGFLSLVVIPTFFTMTLAGVWHGAGSQFLIFGLLHAVYLSINHAWRTFSAKSEGAISRSLWFWKAISVLLTFLAVLVAQIFFRSDGTMSAFSMIFGLIGGHGIEKIPLSVAQHPEISEPVSFWGLVTYSQLKEQISIWKRPLMLAVLFAIVLLLPNTHQIMGSFSPALARSYTPKYRMFSWQPSAIWAVTVAGLFFLCIVMLQNTAKFLYFQF